jgi:UDP-2,3-diacylglucosamine pyrophosphatase LpxH
MKIIPFAFPEEWAELELYPLNDLHIGDPKTDLSLFRRFVNHIKEKPNRIIVCVGDLINNAIKTSVSNVYNETMPPNEQRKFIVEELRPIKDRILCFVSGNHEYRSKKDVDLNPVEWIADKLGIEHYSEDEMALKISVGKSTVNGKPIPYGIYLTHGNGGGKRPGSALNNLELLALTLENVDIIIIGHAHKRIGYRFTCRSFDYQNKRLTPVEKLCVVSSAWQEYGGYAVRKMMIPGCKGTEPIILSGKEKKARAMI